MIRATISMQFIEVTSLLVALCIVPAAFLDPVIGGFVAYTAILLGGVAGLGRKRGPSFAFLTLAVAILGVLILGTYSRNTGFRVPTVTSLTESLVVVAPAVVVWLGLVLVGDFRRRR